MLDILGDVIRNIVIMVILAGLLEMLLPANNMRRYVRLVIGLFLINILINPIVKIAEGEEMSFFSGLPAQEQAASVFADKGKQIAEQNRRKALADYRGAIGRQIKALLRLEKEVRVEDVLVNVEEDAEKNNFGQIREIVIVAARAEAGEAGKGKEAKDEPMVQVNPVKVDVAVPGGASSGTAGDSAGDTKTVNTVWGRRLRGMIADFYGLAPEQVKIEEPAG